MISIVGIISFNMIVPRIKVKNGPKLARIEWIPIGKYFNAKNIEYIILPDTQDLKTTIFH